MLKLLNELHKAFLMAFSSINAWKMSIFLIWCRYPVISYPLGSSYDVTSSVQAVGISLPKQLVFRVKKVVVPHYSSASFRCYNQVGVVTVVTEIERIAFLASF